jgi:uncharacterized protein
MFLRQILLFLFMSLSAHAQGLPEPHSSTVNDFADLLPPEVEARVVDALTKGRQETGVHVAVVTMDRIADYGGAGQRIEDYAKTLFNTWGVGDAGRNDGILILVARSDREMRIALGAGYPVIWDNAAQRVIDRYFLPEFRADRYAAGIEAGVQGTFDLIARPYVTNNPPSDTGVPITDIVQMIMTGLLVAGIVLVAFRQRISTVFARLRKCPRCGNRGLDQSRRILDQPTQNTTGRGEIYRSCPACGEQTIIPYTIAAKSSSSGSSDGFGGGSSSGGGASGRW